MRTQQHLLRPRKHVTSSLKNNKLYQIACRDCSLRPAQIAEYSKTNESLGNKLAEAQSAINRLLVPWEKRTNKEAKDCYVMRLSTLLVQFRRFPRISANGGTMFDEEQTQPPLSPQPIPASSSDQEVVVIAAPYMLVRAH